ncbi:MAG: hypothetical protein GY800_03795 [Planctomycetes bacterium]|nr:hypothetical protein [Planctomycetota bacterium]
MKRFLRFGFSLLLPVLLCNTVSVCSADSTADLFEVSSSTDKPVYDESDTIHVDVRIKNLSSKEQALKPMTDNGFGVGVYQNSMILGIDPNNIDIIDNITVKPGKTKVFKYEFPAYRVVLYTEYAKELNLNIQGPWLEGATLASTPFTIVTSYEELPELTYGPDPRPVNDYFAKNDIFVTGPDDTIVKASEEDLVYLSNLAEAVEFAENTKEFDGLLFYHHYGVSIGATYSERIVALCSKTPTIHTLILRTWPDEGVKSSLPKTLESYRLQYPKVADAEENEEGNRFKVVFKVPSDFGYTSVYDNRGDKMLFNATSVFMGIGGVLYPGMLEKEEIDGLSAERRRLDEELSRAITLEYDGPLGEIEELLFTLGLRVLSIYDSYCYVLIPPGVNRAEYIKSLQKHKIIKNVQGGI